jgi:hypothetical protein
MTCDDFLRAWNDRIDDPGSFATDRAGELDAHGVACEPCRRLASGFRLFVHPLPTPAVPEGLADRVVVAWLARGQRGRRFTAPARWGWAISLAAAAIVLAMFASKVPWRVRTPEVAVQRPPSTRPWTSALAEATSATLDLARETSAPAARWGQDMMIAGSPREFAWPVAIESPAMPSEILETVSRKVNSGVRPLSGSARRAFSFLIAPGPAAAGRSPAKADSEA